MQIPGVPRFALLALLALGGFLPARAQVVILTAPSQFLTVTTLVDFENYPLGGIVPHNTVDLDDEWMSVGVLLRDDSVGDGISAYSATYSQQPVSGTRGVADSVNAPGGFVEFKFVVPGTSTPLTVQEAGIWVLNGDNPSTVTFFDASGTLIQTLTPAAGTTFAGLRASQGIASFRVTDGDYYLTDNLQFTAVPEPGTVVLMGLGLASLAWVRWRRRPRAI
jgi:hypothetical protein